MCVDCVLASPRITQADPGRRTPPRGGSVTASSVQMLPPPTGFGALPVVAAAPGQDPHPFLFLYHAPSQPHCFPFSSPLFQHEEPATPCISLFRSGPFAVSSPQRLFLLPESLLSELNDWRPRHREVKPLPPPLSVGAFPRVVVLQSRGY
jgi:hypothetical protein